MRARRGEARHYIGSADAMRRNLDRRFEVLVTIADDEVKARLDRALHLYLTDDVLAWTLGADGQWLGPPATAGRSAHAAFKAEADEGAAS